MRMPHLMLIVVLFLGFVTLLAHKPQGDEAFAVEPRLTQSSYGDTMAFLSGSVVHQCSDQAGNQGIAERDMNAFMERCTTGMVDEQLAE